MDTTHTTAKAEHTAEPWCYFVGNGDGRGLLRIEADSRSSDAGKHITSLHRGDESRANAARIVAAVNASAGIPTAALELVSHAELVKELDTARWEADISMQVRHALQADIEELREALAALVACHEHASYCTENRSEYRQSEAAALLRSAQNRATELLTKTEVQ